MKLKEKLPLIIGIGLPILLVLFVAIKVYLPPLFVKPQYDFVYATRLYDYDINVVNGKVTLVPRYTSGNRNYNYRPRQPNFFFYDVLNEKSTSVSLAQVQSYKLDPSDKSPDGFTVRRNESDSYLFFPFFHHGYSRGQFLTGKGLSRKITDDYDFKFVGWVLK